MKVDLGVDLSTIHPNLKKVLPIIDLVFYEKGNHLVITATKWGRDPLRLAHEAGHAIDIAFPVYLHLDTYFKLKRVLGCNFIVRQMKTHLHVEYSPIVPKTLKVIQEWCLAQRKGEFD